MKLSKKKIINISLGVSLGVLTIAGVGTILPGMGTESLSFINSVKKEINVVFPKGKYVLDGNGELFEAVVNSSIKTAYISDALSTIKSNDVDAMKQYDAIKDYALQIYHKDWDANIKEHKDIDLHDVGMKLIDFDKSVAKKFHSYGLVNTGIQWFFNGGVKEAFSKDLYNEVLNQQTINVQEDYDQAIISTKPGLAGVNVSYSPGSYLVNNKVWFLNQQIDSIKFAIEPIKGLKFTPFVDKNLSKDDVADYIGVNDLYHPNFTAMLQLTRVGVVLFILFILIAPFLISWIIFENIKDKKIVKNKTKKESKGKK